MKQPFFHDSTNLQFQKAGMAKSDADITNDIQFIIISDTGRQRPTLSSQGRRLRLGESATANLLPAGQGRGRHPLNMSMEYAGFEERKVE
ncbi:hypothetical protein GTO89_15560 [Heliobacterium gestii]|uniref:Uncharacterized protein n=1 Tax=Heliomicrobium gestii TaxID=2699 RepID=A0A845LIQ6_HELGE|nr:hypothetical protein [Heliomicrobium gestii]MBM7868255.1 hypothetical protein [Heliomicrobium gestii]MZP44449.1 hypothetical protein [Heliomicrobium gestii]